MSESTESAWPPPAAKKYAPGPANKGQKALTSAAPATVIIEPVRGWSRLELGQIWEYRDLLRAFFWREVQGRYRQMAFGPLWIILQPVINMIVMSFVFGRLARLPSENIPYPLFVYSALLPWQFFANSARNSAQSLLTQRAIIAKIYFPRLLVPLATVMAALVDYLAALLVLIGLLIYYHVTITWAVLTIPLFLLLAAAVGLAVGFWLAGLAIKFHDVTIGLGFAITIWQYLTPVAYSARLIPDNWQLIYQLNPLTLVVQGSRWALLGAAWQPTWLNGLVVLIVLALLVAGAFYFRRVEQNIVDSI